MLIFETRDKTGRMISLTKERWKHINEDHPEIASYVGYFEETLKKPSMLVPQKEGVAYYYRYFKNKPYLQIIVKYLNGKGFIITAYFTRKVL